MDLKHCDPVWDGKPSSLDPFKKNVLLLPLPPVSLQLLLSLLSHRQVHQEEQEVEEEWRAGWSRSRPAVAARWKLLGGYELVCTTASLPASTLSPVRTQPNATRCPFSVASPLLFTFSLIWQTLIPMPHRWSTHWLKCTELLDARPKCNWVKWLNIMGLG